MAATITLTPAIDQPGMTAKVVSDGSAYKLNCGFAPSWAIFINVTDQASIVYWTKNMAAATALQVTSAGAAQIASAAVTMVDQTDGVNYGLSVGTNAVINLTGKTYDVIIGR